MDTLLQYVDTNKGTTSVLLTNPARAWDDLTDDLSSVFGDKQSATLSVSRIKRKLSNLWSAKKLPQYAGLSDFWLHGTAALDPAKLKPVKMESGKENKGAKRNREEVEDEDDEDDDDQQPPRKVAATNTRRFTTAALPIPSSARKTRPQTRSQKQVRSTISSQSSSIDVEVRAATESSHRRSNTLTRPPTHHTTRKTPTNDRNQHFVDQDSHALVTSLYQQKAPSVYPIHSRAFLPPTRILQKAQNVP